MVSTPHLRLWNEDPPDYGGDPDLFTVQIEHNGFFCGLVVNLCYTDGTMDFYDNCSLDTFSLLWIQDFIKELGHELDDRVHVYWCMPGKAITNGLVSIEKDADILTLTTAAQEHKRICLMIDHTNFLKQLRDEVIINLGPELPPVISPKKVPKPRAEASSSGGNDVADAGETGKGEELEEGTQSGGEETDSDFFDSDYDAADGDDDIFDSYVDKDVNDNNEHVQVHDVENDAVIGDEDLRLSKEQEEQLQYKFTEFNPEVDMDRPEFKLGMVFADAKELRHALRSYCIRNRVKVKKIRNTVVRIDAICEKGCPWMLKASVDSRTEGMIVRKILDKHTCQKVWELKALSAPFLTKYFIEEFRDNQKMDLKTFAAKVQRQFNMCPNRWKLSRARKEALKQIHGDEAVQFSSLWDYGQELRRSNPGSSFFCSTTSSKDNSDVEPKEHLSTLYWSYDACKRGFLKGCRPLICIDGCHIKTRYKGQLLTAVGIDPNDCIYPIAMGLVEVECTSSWEWFLTNLRDDLNITNTSPFTIMSDRQKGLINAVKKIFPDARHRHCVRHIYQNFHKLHKGETLKKDLWAIARSPNIPTWQKNLDKIKVDSQAAYEWVEELQPNTWIKGFFSESPKCDMLLNNHCEVFNSYILEAREMPILSMLENIFYKLLHRIVTKQEEAKEWSGRICPKIKKKLDKITEFAAGCNVLCAGGGIFHVTSGELEKEYIVDLKGRTCDCNRWQLSGIPCHHAIACCRAERMDAEQLVHSCYTIETYNAAYGYNMVPLRARVHWVKQNGVKIHPPLYTKVMGRPKKNRRKAPEEKEKKGAKIITRAGLTMHCSLCGKADHNKKGHYKYMESENTNEMGEEMGEEHDIPSILQNIIPRNPDPAHDPTNQVDMMVYKMGQEDRAHVTQIRSHGPLPDESSFVAAARDSIPQARVTTAMTRGRGTSKRRGPGRGQADTQAIGAGQAVTQGTGVGRGRRGKKRNAESTSSDPAPEATDKERINSYNTGPGSAYYLLFGDANTNGPLPDLNEAVADEVQITQNAPGAGT